MIDLRDRMTEGVTRERLKMEARRAARPVVVFIAGIAVTFGIIALAIVQISETVGRSTYQVRFAVDNTFGIFEGFDDVRFRGVPAGTIKKIERRGSQLVLLADIKEKYGPVYRNARAEVRPITPLNDVYLDIVDPGTAQAGKADPGEPLPEEQTATSVTVPDVLDGLDADARIGAHRLLDQLGNGMDDGGLRLKRAFVALAPFLKGAGDLSRQVAAREKATARLVHNTAVLTTELGRREAQLKRLVAEGSATLGTLQAGSRDLDATLSQLSPTFSELRLSLQAVRGVVGDVDAGLRSLYPVADRLPQGLKATRALAGDLGPAARALREPIRGFNRWVAGVDLTGDRLGPTFGQLLKEPPTINRLTQRLVDCEKGQIGFWQWNASLSKYGDENGPIPRGNLAAGSPDLGMPGAPKRPPAKACAPGSPISSVPGPEDLH